MADEQQLSVLRQGVDAWNAWRKQNLEIPVDLSGANLSEAHLPYANLSGANLSGANLQIANLLEANLSEANLSEANLVRAHLPDANLSGANLSEAHLPHAILFEADLSGANLSRAHISGANLSVASLSGANLSGANLFATNLSEADLGGANLSGANLGGANLVDAILSGANLSEANLSGADLSAATLSAANLQEANLSGANLGRAILGGANLREANLRRALLVDTNFTGADLTGCLVYGISAWDLKLDDAVQKDLIITPHDGPEVTVDNLEVAQFIYLLLNNERVRDVIDTITSKVVLILGRFTPERKVVLDALRQELRRHNLTPVLFDFDIPDNRDITETVTLLARMARFIVADLTDPASIPMELQAIAPDVAVPIRSLVQKGQKPFSMFSTLKKYHWVLPPYPYSDLNELLANLEDEIIAPAEAKARELRGVLPPAQ